ncbi:hypothetical protein ScPMuIL_018622 [Solemya velum]
MSDRAANEKKVTKLLINKKRALLENSHISQAEKDERAHVYSFTCAAHKINNMALAMTSAAEKEMHADDTSTVRSMKGATKHIYEVNKLLCEQSRKEYSLGVDFAMYNLGEGTSSSSGASLFKPIVGNRYLIFLHNAIPTLCSKDIVMVYLEDVRDGKDKVGLNRLETAVRTGYLDMTIESEEVAFALMYFHVCSKLLSKAKSVSSPLEMNTFYSQAIDALGLWCADPSSLIDGSVEMWPTSQEDSYIAEMVDKVRAMGDPELVNKTLKVMAKAGMEKLASHAEEHLPGGLYYEPSPAAEEAARTIGEATNDRIESMFGMLDRRMTFAPTSNPLNAGHLIAAKNDRVVSWAKDQVTDLEKVCEVARKFSTKEKRQEGTRIEQLNKLHKRKRERKKELIAKRRFKRQEKERVRQEKLVNIDNKLIRQPALVSSLSNQELVEQCQLWKLLGEGETVHALDNFKGFSLKKKTEKKELLMSVVSANLEAVEMTSNSKTGSASECESEWCTSDEDTLDTLIDR